MKSTKILRSKTEAKFCYYRSESLVATTSATYTNKELFSLSLSKRMSLAHQLKLWQVLVGETSEPSLRGVLSSSPNLAYSLGILVIYVLGSVLPWRVVAAVSTVLPLTGFILLAALPESPVWLVNQGNIDKARKSLLWLRGGDSSKVGSRFKSR